MVLRCRLHTCSSWLRVCCWAVMCCARAGHVAAGVAARRHMIRPEERVFIIPVVDRSNNSPFYVIASGATAVECPHQLKPSNRQTSCPGSRAGAPVCQRANPAVAVVRYSWCCAVGFTRAAFGCVCAVGLSCAVRVLAMWLQVWLQDDT